MVKRQIILMPMIVFLFLWRGVSMDAKAPLLEEEDQGFIKEEMKWRAQRDKEMRSPTSLLSVAGLFWLEEGENRFGFASSNKIRLPSGSAPSFGGKFILKEGKVKVVVNEGTKLRVEGKEIKEMFLTGDDAGKPNIVELGDLRMWVIKRGDRYAIRLRDSNAPAYKNYKGLDFFPPENKFKIEADFIPYSPRKTISTATIIGTETKMVSPGYVKFVINGKEYRLDAFQGDAKSTKLFFIFSDETNGEETYGGGRFMYSDILENGKVDLNFNRAYNPPCSYTPYFTCPLPPPQNFLKVRIEAGERKYPGGRDYIKNLIRDPNGG